MNKFNDKAEHKQRSPLKYGNIEFILLILSIVVLSLVLINRITNTIIEKELLTQARAIAETVDHVGKWVGSSHDHQIWMNSPNQQEPSKSRFISTVEIPANKQQNSIRLVSKNPANVINSIADFVDLEENYKIKFKLTSHNPFNHSNKSSPFGMRAIHEIKQNPKKTEYFEFEDDLFLYGKAIIHSKENCLSCHYSAQTAPADLVSGYGKHSGFGFQLNDIAGVLEVSIPHSPLWSRLGIVDYLLYMMILLILFLFMFFRVIPSYRQLIDRNDSLNIKLDQSIDSEHQRLSVFLHDNVSGVINGIRFSLAGIRKKLKNKSLDDEQIEKHFTFIEEQLKECYQSTRTMGTDLFSETLLTQGVIHAIEELVSAKDNSAITFSFEATDIDQTRLKPEICTDIYRITQELLLNVEKHSKANLCKIHFFRINNKLCINIKDNGIGFKKQNTEGLGLGIVRNRIQTLNANLAIKTENGLELDISIENAFI